MSVPLRSLELFVLPEQFMVARLAADAAVPAWALQGPFFSVTRTPDELSIVCAIEQVPQALRRDTRWSAFKVRGPIALSEIGVLAAVAEPLAAAQISVFVVSTYETDYVLVNSEQLPNALIALQKAGHKIDGTKIESAKSSWRTTQ